MKIYLNYRKFILIGLFQLFTLLPLLAQDLDPRAYLWLPIKTSTIVAGYSYSAGAVLTDPTIPIEDLDATVQSISFGMVHTFSLFGLTSQALASLPYAWAQVSGNVVGQAQQVYRSGLGDSRMRLTVLVHGAPAAGIAEIMNAPRRTLIGVSMNLTAPTGQFFPDKLINLGTNRWSFRPELAISKPLSKRWLMDLYAGTWFFTTNNEFFPGRSKRTQEPMGAFQAHISYNITPRFWIATNWTYYVGGKSSVDGTYNDDRVNNTRIGLTAVMPVGKANSIKLAMSTGAIVRIGQDFTTFSFGWQHSWFGKSKFDLKD